MAKPIILPEKNAGGLNQDAMRKLAVREAMHREQQAILSDFYRTVLLQLITFGSPDGETEMNKFVLEARYKARRLTEKALVVSEKDLKNGYTSKHHFDGSDSPSGPAETEAASDQDRRQGDGSELPA